MDEHNIEDFAKYLSGFVNDTRLEFNLANDRFATRILIEALLLIAGKIEGVSKRMLILHHALEDINKTLEEKMAKYYNSSSMGEILISSMKTRHIYFAMKKLERSVFISTTDDGQD